MKELIQYLEKKGACDKLIATNWEELREQMFSSMGVEYLKKGKISKEVFTKYKNKIGNIYVDQRITLENKDALLINSVAYIQIDNLDKVYKIVLLNGSKATIIASNHAVIKIDCIGGSYEIIKDKTVVVL